MGTSGRGQEEEAGAEEGTPCAFLQVGRVGAPLSSQQGLRTPKLAPKLASSSLRQRGLRTAPHQGKKARLEPCQSPLRRHAEAQGWGAAGSRRQKQQLHVPPGAGPEKWVLTWRQASHAASGLPDQH